MSRRSNTPKADNDEQTATGATTPQEPTTGGSASGGADGDANAVGADAPGGGRDGGADVGGSDSVEPGVVPNDEGAEPGAETPEPEPGTLRWFLAEAKANPGSVYRDGSGVAWQWNDDCAFEYFDKDDGVWRDCFGDDEVKELAGEGDGWTGPHPAEGTFDWFVQSAQAEPGEVFTTNDDTGVVWRWKEEEGFEAQSGDDPQWVPWGTDEFDAEDRAAEWVRWEATPLIIALPEATPEPPVIAPEPEPEPEAKSETAVYVMGSGEQPPDGLSIGLTAEESDRFWHAVLDTRARQSGEVLRRMTVMGQDAQVIVTTDRKQTTANFFRGLAGRASAQAVVERLEAQVGQCHAEVERIKREIGEREYEIKSRTHHIRNKNDRKEIFEAIEADTATLGTEHMPEEGFSETQWLSLVEFTSEKNQLAGELKTAQDREKSVRTKVNDAKETLGEQPFLSLIWPRTVAIAPSLD